MSITAAPAGDVQRMILLYRAGFSLREIACEMHYEHSTIRTHLIRAGIRLRPRGSSTHRELPHRVYERTVRLRRQGLTLKQISLLEGRAESTIHYRLRRAGIR